MIKCDKQKAMNNFKLTYSLIYLLPMFLFLGVGCTSESEEIQPDDTETNLPISWSVQSVQEKETRALVDGTVLQNLCMETADGTNESIGIWGRYVFMDEETGVKTEEEVFTATPLTYALQDDTYVWRYTGELRYWVPEAVYDFRACYPQKVVTSLMTQMDATMFQGGPINTEVLQEDILVSAIQVDTKTADLTNPVPLNFQHVFAALKFKVKAASGFNPPTGEGITSCWLQNETAATDLFSPSGYLVYSSDITWRPYESSTAPMYLWKHRGLSFNSEVELYTSNSGQDGEVYTGNGGWLLVVPQQVKAGTLNFCYTMKEMGDKVFSVKIPAITYEPGKKYSYMLEIDGSDMELILTIEPWNKLDISYDIKV